MNNLLQQLESYLQSDEGKLQSKLYFEKLHNQDMIRNMQCERFHLNYSYNIDYLLEKVQNKYNSSDYVNREYSIGREPREYLYEFLFDVARIYGKYIKLSEDFLSDSYLYKGYIFKLFQGQGSFITIEKYGTV